METRSPSHETAEIPAASPSFEELAAQQGVQPIREFAELLGEHHHGDETPEEFAELLQSWRSEGVRTGSHR